MASITEAPDGTTPAASFDRNASPKATIDAMLEATNAISIRRNSSSPATHVVNTNVTNPIAHPRATRACPRRAITACAVASASM